MLPLFIFRGLIKNKLEIFSLTKLLLIDIFYLLITSINNIEEIYYEFI
jgi:hypothetical protein